MPGKLDLGVAWALERNRCVWFGLVVFVFDGYGEISFAAVDARTILRGSAATHSAVFYRGLFWIITGIIPVQIMGRLLGKASLMVTGRTTLANIVGTTTGTGLLFLPWPRKTRIVFTTTVGNRAAILMAAATTPASIVSVSTISSTVPFQAAIPVFTTLFIISSALFFTHVIAFVVARYTAYAWIWI